MKLYRILIVTSNEGDNERLKRLIQKGPYLSNIISVNKFEEAFSSISRQLPDAVFLDMKTVTFEQADLLFDFCHPYFPIVGFSHDYLDAVSSYTLGFADFILGPFNENRIVVTLRRISKYLLIAKGVSETESVYLKMGKEYLKIMLNDLLYIEASGNSTKVFSNKGRHIVNDSILKLQGKLNSFNFLRVHKSYIVNLQSINSFSSSYFELSSGVKIPIGSKYRQKTETLLLLLDQPV